jgi:hypothetical protein
MSRQPQGNSLSQPTPRVGNLYRRKRDAVPADRRSGSQTQRTESGSSNSTRTLQPESGSSSGRSSSPPQNTRRPLSRPAKRPRRSTLQATAYTEHEEEPGAQPQIETVRLSDDSSDEYQNSHRSDETESDTEPDAEENDNPDHNTESGPRRRSRTGDRRQTNTRVSTVRVSTTSGSQELAPVAHTPAARRRMNQGSAYTPPMFTSSSVPPYSSPLASHSATTSGVRSSSPPGDPSTQRHENIWPHTNSRRNIATGAEAAVIERAKTLILRYTLFVNPLPPPATLMSEVHRAWLKALDDISDAGNLEASEASIKLVRGRRYSNITHVAGVY